MKKVSVSKKVGFSCLIVALVIGLSYLGYYLIHYTFYNEYKDYILGTTYAEGKPFKAVSDTDRPEELAEDFVLAAKNESLKLYYNQATTEVAVVSVKTGKITYSNPQNVEKEDYSTGVYLNNMKSQLILHYYKAKGDSSDAIMDSYSYCINMKKTEEDAEPQFGVEAIENGIRVNYQIGDVSNADGTVPKFASKEKFDEILEKLKAYDEENGTKFYKSVKNVYGESKTKKGFMERNEGVKKRALLKLQEAFDAVGWTEADYAEQMEAAGAEVVLPVSFEIPLEYTLDGDKLQVKVVTDHIVENGGGTLISMDVLPYFGAEYYSYETENFAVYEYTVVEEEVAVTPDAEESTEESNEEASEETTEEVAEEAAEEDTTTEDAETTEDTEAEGDTEESGNASTPAAGMVIKKVISEYMTADVHDCDDEECPLMVSVSNDIIGEASFANIYIKKVSYDDMGVELKDEDGFLDGELVDQFTSNDSNISFLAEENVDYVINIETYGQYGSEINQIKFTVGPEKLPASGYVLVPNGSGSLIYFNSENCDGAADYSERVYGSDDVLFDADTKVQETESVKLPIFGLSSNDSDMFVILARGESLAELHVQTANNETCKLSESLTNYNTAYCRYYLRAENTVQMSTTDSFIVWNDNIFDTEITQLYCFLDDEHKGYTGMANYYRDYLIAKGDLVQSEATNEDNTGLYIDLIGAVKGDVQTFGFTHESVIPMTTFDQATEIVNKYYDNNINNLVINYQGWMNGGYYHETADDISVIHKLGGKGDLKDFTALVESKGGKVYGDMALLKVSYQAEEFQYNLESSRIYGTGFVASYGKSSPVTYSNAGAIGYRANLYNILSVKFLPRYVQDSLKEMEKIPMTGVSYRDLGTVVYSDMKKTNVIHREHAKEIIEAMLKKAAESENSVMLNDALGYALAYADDIINVPLGDNNYRYVDTEVPFYQMIIHGYINYAGEPINLSADTTTQDNILSCVEYGASPHFTLTYEPSTDMKYTALNDKYATNYVNWIEESTAIYNEVNSVLSKVTKASIIDHEIVADTNNQVKKVTYSNGVTIYVNYSKYDFEVDGINVPAKNFVVK